MMSPALLLIWIPVIVVAAILVPGALVLGAAVGISSSGQWPVASEERGVSSNGTENWNRERRRLPQQGTDQVQPREHDPPPPEQLQGAGPLPVPGVVLLVPPRGLADHPIGGEQQPDPEAGEE
jgi:hypothetical protein